MPRAIVLGNGDLLINLDKNLNMRDLFYPVVGLDNHIGGQRCSTGFWEEGTFSWLWEDSWQKKLAYQQDSLVSLVQARSEQMGLELVINDGVHYFHNLFIRQMTIKNNKNWSRRVRIFFNHDFSISGNNIGDTAFFDPVSRGVCHYKRNIYIMANGITQGKGVFQYATGRKRFRGAEGTWKDAEDGWLEGNPIDHGSVDSTISFEMHLEAGEEENLWYWMVLGDRLDAVRGLDALVREQRPGYLLEETKRYWRNWVNRYDWNFGDLPEKVFNLFKQSLLIIRTQCDNNGAIIAASDSDVLATARDHYSYIWPRDGALVAVALDRVGFPEIPLRYFRLSSQMLTEGGFNLQRYNADGTPGSSWYPLSRDGEERLPIQEDETALINYALWHHYQCFRDFEEIAPFYWSLIKRIGDFLLSYRDPDSGLPLPSFDLWEERRGVFSFTAATVYAGLNAAANFADLFGDLNSSDRYRQGAAELRDGMERYLYHQELGRFLRGIYYSHKKGKVELIPDFTLDSSLYGLFGFGVFPADDPRVIRTMEAVRDGLKVNTWVGGLARYSGDWYYRMSDDLENVPGSPWIITTLWLAEWYTAVAKSKEELLPARLLLEWAADRALGSGVLAEQFHPYTGEPLSVAPLTWSHSTFILAVANYLEKWQTLP